MAKLNVRGKILDPRYNYETRLELLNLDKECIKDITSANGFFVEEPQNIKKDLKSPDSIFSIRFGTVNGEADVFMNRYRCKCGALRGRINHNPSKQNEQIMEKHILIYSHQPYTSS